MKVRYYLSMLSVFLVVALYDVVYILVGEGRGYTISSAVVDAVIFLGLNLIGIYYLYKPIDRFLQGKAEFDSVRDRIVALPRRSALWAGVLGFAYCLWVLGELLNSDPSLTPLRYASIATGLFLGYLLFPMFYISFLISNYNISLKEYIYRRFGFIFPSGRLKFWQKLLGSYIVVSVVPMAFIVLDMASVESWERVSAILKQDIATDVVSVFLCIGVAAAFLTRGLTKPVNLLTSSLEKVGEGDYSVRVPVVSGDEIGILTANFNSMVEGLSEREFIRDTFGRYLTEEVAAEILKQKVK
ncbi:MAG TPA: HAMP domain-containing protein, partial [Proteobacteria bacterium]|nr:HAMP domain-containing protein [Pseudomonadota bacterium]